MVSPACLSGALQSLMSPRAITRCMMYKKNPASLLPLSCFHSLSLSLFFLYLSWDPSSPPPSHNKPPLYKICCSSISIIIITLGVEGWGGSLPLFCHTRIPLLLTHNRFAFWPSSHYISTSNPGQHEAEWLTILADVCSEPLPG